MSIIRWQPWQEMDSLRRQMDRLFDDFMPSSSTLSLLPKATEATWAPAIELQETDSEILLKAQIPGIEAKDLDIQVTQDAVSITGEKQEEAKTEEKGMFRSEFRYGQFQRLIPLPASVNNEQVKSEFKNGVLTLTLPKLAETPPKVVKVTVGSEPRVKAAPETAPPLEKSRKPVGTAS
jgi:HSP20 family protein